MVKSCFCCEQSKFAICKSASHFWVERFYLNSASELTTLRLFLSTRWTSQTRGVLGLNLIILFPHDLR